IYLMLAAVFGVGMVAYFGSSGPLGGAANQRAVPEQDAGVTVNGEPVTQGGVDKQWGRRKRVFGGKEPNPPQGQGETRPQPINSALQTAIAKQRGLTVSDADIDKAIDEQKKAGGKPIPDSDWQKMLEAQGISERDLRDSLRTGLLPAVLMDTFKSQVKASE